MKNIITLILTLFLLAGCGSDFQWLPENQPIPPTPPTPAGTVKKTIPFPAGISWVIDVASDRTGATLWLLVSPNSTSAATALVQVSTSTGQVVNTLPANSWPVFLNQSSSLAFDGQRFWATSFGAAPKNFIYELDGTARIIATFECPATTTGFCQGLAWDGATFWTAGSDNATLTKFQIVGTAPPISQNYNNLWDTSGVTDVAFDAGTKQVLVTKNQLLFFSPPQAIVAAKQTLPQTGAGDWDGSLLWVIDNTNRKILGMTIR